MVPGTDHGSKWLLNISRSSSASKLNRQRGLISAHGVGEKLSAGHVMHVDDPSVDPCFSETICCTTTLEYRASKAKDHYRPRGTGLPKV